MSKEETVVERVAKATLKVQFFDGDEDQYEDIDAFYRDLDPDHWFNAMAMAGAAIDALMEPTPEMVDAGNDISDYALIPKQIEQIYRAMLSKAKEGTGE